MCLSRYCEAELRAGRIVYSECSIVLPRVWMSVTWSPPDTLTHSPACSLHNIALCDNNEMSHHWCPAMSQSRMTDGEQSQVTGPDCDQVEACSDRTDQQEAWILSPVSALVACLQVVQCIVPSPIRLAPGGYMTQTAGLVSRQNSDTFSREILLWGSEGGSIFKIFTKYPNVIWEENLQKIFFINQDGIY